MIRWFKRIAMLVVAVVIATVIAGWWLLRGSLPTLDGEAVIVGLSAPVTLQRDALGAVTIAAANETDALRALGYVHAQERFFEMDLLRRTAAGELSELFGPVALDLDKRHRVHRMRARVEARLTAIAGSRMPQLRAYADGVNAGRDALRVRPWPYLLLRQPPRVWQPADSALAGYAMYFDLQDAGNTRERALAQIRPHLPRALFDLLVRDGTRWDAPLMGAPRGDAPLPDAATVDLRMLPMPASTSGGKPASDIAPGSNNFAVAAARTADGRAIVVNDMHLGLRAPNLWFRVRLRYPDARATDGQVDVTGFTLPGLPAVVVGSNTQVAWGFTNSYIDTADWAAEVDCAAVSHRDGCARTRTVVERIAVAGAAPVALPVTTTAWGPVLRREGGGMRTLRWAAHLPGALNFGLADFAHARDLDDALAIAARTALPTQNLAIADRSGRIAWQLLGPIPDRGDRCRAGKAVATPIIRSADTAAVAAGGSDQLCSGWHLRSDLSPHIVDPPAGALWTANARVLDGDALTRVGNGGYAFGARARQIRDALAARKTVTERDLLAIQLDDRAVFMSQWWQRLRETAADAKSPALRELADAAKPWQGRASVDSASYRIVRAWRLAVHARIADGLTAPAQVALGDTFVMPDLPQLEGVVWPLVRQRPANLLPARFASWDALLEDAAVEVRDQLAAIGTIGERGWGERNTAAICHPLAKAIPQIGTRLLCMPPDPLPGDSMMPRVQGPAFGASQRMVVSPGHEADAIAHMPGGQSGHPLSPFWGAGHDDWVQGRATPFLPGPAEHTMTLSLR
ncbi:MAG: penicillin acylase family protein [Luteimonas sp.]